MPLTDYNDRIQNMKSSIVISVLLLALGCIACPAENAGANNNAAGTVTNSQRTESNNTLLRLSNGNTTVPEDSDIARTEAVSENETQEPRYIVIRINRVDPVPSFVPGGGKADTFSGGFQHGLYDRQRTMQRKDEQLVTPGTEVNIDLTNPETTATVRLLISDNIAPGTYYLDAMLDTDASGGQSKGDLARKSSVPVTIAESGNSYVTFTFTNMVPF